MTTHPDQTQGKQGEARATPQRPVEPEPQIGHMAQQDIGSIAGSVPQESDLAGEDGLDALDTPQRQAAGMHLDSGVLATPSMKSREHVHEKASEFLDHQLNAAVISMRQNMRINTMVRAWFYLLAVALLALVVYIIWRQQEFFLFIGPGEAAVQDGMIAMALPLLAIVLIAAVCVALALLIQNRGVSEFAKSLDQVSRLRREGTAANSRSLALTQILEETLSNARQAFSMQLWISRVLFVVGIVLVFTFIVSLIGNDPWVSGGAVVTSILALAGSALLNPQRQIGADLANVTQLEAILGGYIRQASMLEEHIYQVMETSSEAGTPWSANSLVLSGVDRLSSVLKSAVKAIDDQIHASDRVSGREVWLWRQVASSNGDSSRNETDLSRK